MDQSALPGFTLKHYRAIVGAVLAALAALAWLTMFRLASDMVGMDMPAMSTTAPEPATWHSEELLLTFLMWAIMMVAMMTPSAVPMILAYAGLCRRRHAGRITYGATALFFLGYVTVWTLFSAAATLLQWGFHTANLLSPATISVTPFLGGILLVTAGLYQLTPLKNACLTHCRSPLGFLISEWRQEPAGVPIMGIRHGLYCLGCCWLLMALLFVAGVMNLLWVAFIAGYVLVEKVAPAGHWVGHVMGILAIAWGLALLFGPIAP